MKDTDYAYCVARLRAAESNMLTDSDIAKLLESADFDSAVKFLKDKNWVTEGECASDYIAFQRKQLWKLLSESVPNKKELDVLCILNDFFNIKAAVKCLLCGKDVADYFAYPSTVNLETLTAKLKEHNFVSAFGNNSDTAQKAYEAAVKTESGQSADIIIDKAAIQCCLEYYKERKNDIAGKICAFICDSSNIKIAVRCALTGKSRGFIEKAVGECSKLSREKLINEAINGIEALFSYLDSTDYADGAVEYKKSSASYEKWCDEQILNIASGAKYTAFGFGPVCLYYYKKLSEIKNVSIILSGLSAGADKNMLRERVGCLDV